MLNFFATILILYLLWIIVKPYLFRYAQRKYTEKINDMFTQTFNQQFGEAASHGGTQPRRRRSQKRKIFTREDGEYVEFEEIEVKTDYSSSSSFQDDSYTPREPQVSDADWEDIK